VTPNPTASTTPDKSDPSVSGGCGATLLLPSRIRASQGPTPVAATFTSTSPDPGTGTATSSTTITSGPPKLWIRAAFMLSAPAQYVGMWLMLHRHRRRTPSPAIDNAPPARIPVAAHAMQSYYNFDVEGMQQRASQVLSSALVLHLRPRECGHL